VNSRTISDIEGPWKHPEAETALTDACKKYWDVPFPDLPNAVLAMFIRQRIGLPFVVDEAKIRVHNGFQDGSELYEEELANALAKSREA
jgi:hypothetical protein